MATVVVATGTIAIGGMPASADRYGDVDPQGDVASAQADIVGHHARHAGDRFDVWIRLVDVPDSTRVSSTAKSFFVEASVDGDDEPDGYAGVEYDAASGQWLTTTYHLASDEPCASAPTASPFANRPVRIAVTLSCWGSPEAIRYGVDVIYEERATGVHIDLAPEDTLTPPVRRSTATGEGYWLLGRDGGIFSFGDARFYGSTGNMRLNQPVVAMAGHPTGAGYWFVAGDGGVFTFGAAGFHGSTGNIRLNQPIVGMASTPSGNGYWLVASDGGIFTFGDAAFYGSTGDIRLAQPIVGMASTPTGKGYWLVARDGGIFTFGDARFFGSLAGKTNGRPVSAMAPSLSGGGYWIITVDGFVMNFGDATGVFSLTRFGAIPPISGVAAGPNGGARAVGVDGRVYEMADSHHGDMRGVPLSAPVIGIATTA